VTLRGALLFSWLARTSVSTSRPGRARLRLEALEDRTVPSADPLEPPIPDPLPPTEPTVAPPPAEPPSAPAPEAPVWDSWTEADWEAFWLDFYDAHDSAIGDYTEESESEFADDEVPASEAAPAFTPPVWFNEAKLYSATAEGVTFQKWSKFFDTQHPRTGAVFRLLDTNEDDKITLAELEAASTGTAEQKLAVADANWAYAKVTTTMLDHERIALLRDSELVPEGATGITGARWQAVFGDSTEMADFFAALDADGNGTITHADIVALCSTGKKADYETIWLAELVAHLIPANSTANTRPTNSSGTGGEGTDETGGLSAEQWARYKRGVLIENLGVSTLPYTKMSGSAHDVRHAPNPTGATQYERYNPKLAGVLKDEEPEALARLAEIGKLFNSRDEKGFWHIDYDTELTDAQLAELHQEVRDLNKKLTDTIRRTAALRDVTDAVGAAGIADPTGVASAGEAVLELFQGNFSNAAIAAVGAIPIFGKLVKAGRLQKAPQRIDPVLDAVASKRSQAYLEGWAPTRKQWQRAEAELKEYKITLNRNADDLLDKINTDYLGGFNPETGELLLRANTTTYVLFHEMTHARQWARLGKEEYLKLHPFDRELHVYKQIMHHRGLFSAAELRDARRYIDDLAERYNRTVD
jgi:hypothetical protein